LPLIARTAAEPAATIAVLLLLLLPTPLLLPNFPCSLLLLLWPWLQSNHSSASGRSNMLQHCYAQCAADTIQPRQLRCCCCYCCDYI
jgi:hypothetical protein